MALREQVFAGLRAFVNNMAALPAIFLFGVEKEKKNDLPGGIFGDICQVKYAGKSYAAQSFGVEWRDDLEQRLLQECNVWSKIRHPNIVQFIGLWRRKSSNSFPVIVTEKIQCSLRSLMDSDDGISKVNLLSVFGDVALGLWYLHVQSPPIVHGGIVPENVLLQFSSCGHCSRLQLQVAKITNVGMAKVMELDHSHGGEQKSACLPFISLEARNDNPLYKPSCDVFAFGSLIWCSAVTHNLLEQPKMSEDPVAIQEQLKELKNNLKVSLEECENLKSWVGKCWRKVPNERPTIEQISEYLQSMNAQTDKVSHLLALIWSI